MGDLGTNARVDLNALIAQAGMPVLTQTASGQAIRAIVSLASDHFEMPVLEAVETTRHISDALPLFQPLVESQRPVAEHDEPDEMRLWRATGEEAHVPPGVIGQMVHNATS
jgi:hypothetical protein